MTNDLISNMLISIKNASLKGQAFTDITYSKYNLLILNVLKAEGFIENFETFGKFKIRITLKYKGWWIKQPIFSIIKRISKPGQRIFSSYKNFNKIINTLNYKEGIIIVSTSSGVMSHSKALKLKKGGELICFIG